MVYKGQGDRIESIMTKESGVLNLDMTTIYSIGTTGGGTLPYDAADSVGLSDENIEALFRGWYRIIRHENSSGVFEIWSHNGQYDPITGECTLYLTFGDMKTLYVCVTMKRVYFGADWSITINEE